jgi:hypothetical protein
MVPKVAWEDANRLRRSSVHYQIWGRKRQWWQHTKANVFAEPFMSRFPAGQRQWDIATADHADPGRVARLMLSLFGSLTPCASLRVRNTLPCSKRQKLANGNTVRNAVAIL